MKKIIYIFSLVAFTLISCNKNEVEVNSNITITDNIQSHKIIKVVKKLENPYSVTNMKKAYAALQEEGLMKVPLDINATHLYVRFMPKSESEYNTLLNDTLLTLFSHPLDCELTEGEYYIDSTLENNNYQWLYTKVPVGYVSPIKEFEILEELYLPMDSKQSSIQDNSSLRIKSFSNVANYWTILENKSLLITHNIKPSIEDSINKQQKVTSKWTPTATIRVQKLYLNDFVGLAGIKVHARNWFNWESGITNSSGLATMSGTFNSQQIDWSFNWQGNDFNILQGEWMLQAGYSKTQDGHMTFEIKQGMMSFCYANSYRACYDYWNNNLGLKTPYNSSFWKQKINVGVFDNTGRPSTLASGWVLGSRIKIFRYAAIPSGKSEQNSQELFEATIHELNHISYWQLNPDLMDKENIQLIESWAKGVEYSFSSLYYIQSTGFDAFQCARDYELWNSNSKYENGTYTPIIIDLIDNFNQGAAYPSYGMVDDRVSGYTIEEIEKAIKNTATLIVLKQNLIDLYDKPTEQYLDRLFDFYIKK